MFSFIHKRPLDSFYCNIQKMSVNAWCHVKLHFSPDPTIYTHHRLRLVFVRIILNLLIHFPSAKHLLGPHIMLMNIIVWSCGQDLFSAWHFCTQIKEYTRRFLQLRNRNAPRNSILPISMGISIFHFQIFYQQTFTLTKWQRNVFFLFSETTPEVHACLCNEIPQQSRDANSLPCVRIRTIISTPWQSAVFPYDEPTAYVSMEASRRNLSMEASHSKVRKPQYCKII